MNIHEYQAKQLLSQNGIKIPRGKIAYTVAEAKRAAKAVSAKGPWMLKAQIQSGARKSGRFLEAKAGTEGGIRLIKRLSEIEPQAEQMLGSTLVTRQTGPKGRLVSRLYVEAYQKANAVFYAGMAIDRVNAQITLLVANIKNEDIDTIITERVTDRVMRFPLDLVRGPTHAQTNKAAEFLKLSPKSFNAFYQFIRGMYKTFINSEALMIEINPAGVLKNNDIMAFDAKITLDDKALYRHPENLHFRDDGETDSRELKASKFGFRYREFDGNIGCIINGNGLAMATMDLLKNSGNALACSLNVKGGVDRDKIAAGIKIIATNPRVEGIIINILGGFVRCDLIADGIIDAAAEVGMNMPLVVRFEGTNREEAQNILLRANLPLVLVNSLEDSVSRIIKALQERD